MGASQFPNPVQRVTMATLVGVAKTRGSAEQSASGSTPFLARCAHVPSASRVSFAIPMSRPPQATKATWHGGTFKRSTIRHFCCETQGARRVHSASTTADYATTCMFWVCDRACVRAGGTKDACELVISHSPATISRGAISHYRSRTGSFHAATESHKGVQHDYCRAKGNPLTNVHLPPSRP